MAPIKYEAPHDEEETGLLRKESSRKEGLRNGRCHVALFAASTVLLIVNAVFLAWNVLKTPGAHQISGLSKMNDFIPDFPREISFFEHASEFTQISAYSDLMWEDLLPIGVGYFTVEDPRKHGLPESRPAPNSTVGEKEEYLVTFAHQLHCVAVIREMMIAHEKGEKSMFDGGHHQFHCLDKIRQAIMCHADTAIEVGYPKKDDDGNIVSWYYTDNQQPHMCRNWDTMRDWFYQHRANDKHGLLVI